MTERQTILSLCREYRRAGDIPALRKVQESRAVRYRRCTADERNAVAAWRRGDGMDRWDNINCVAE